MFTSLYRNQRHQVQQPRLYVLPAYHCYIEGKRSETVKSSVRCHREELRVHTTCKSRLRSKNWFRFHCHLPVITDMLINRFCCTIRDTDEFLHSLLPFFSSVLLIRIHVGKIRSSSAQQLQPTSHAKFQCGC